VILSHKNSSFAAVSQKQLFLSDKQKFKNQNLPKTQRFQEVLTFIF